MDLKSRNFAFFDPASLFVFTDPFSPFPRVRDFLFTDEMPDRWREAQKLWGRLSGNEQTDFIFRISAQFHERQHFHDMLMTPYGSVLIRAFFMFAARMCALLGRFLARERHAPVIPLPIMNSYVGCPDLLESTSLAYKHYVECLKNARYCFEASAMLTHKLAIRDILGEGPQAAFSKSVENSALYGQLPDFIDYVLTRLLKSGEQVNVFHMRMLILMALCEKEPDTTLKALLKSISAAAEWIERGNKESESIAAAISEARVGLASLFHDTRIQNLSFLVNELLPEMRSLGLPQEVQDVLSLGFTNYLQTFSISSRLLVERTEELLGEWGLLNSPKGMVEPHVYIFVDSSNQHAAVLRGDPNMEIDQEDLYSFIVLDDGRKVVRLMPSPWVIGESFLDKKVWLEIAKGPVGAAALLNPNFEHPLQGWWLRTTSNMLKTEFVCAR